MKDLRRRALLSAAVLLVVSFTSTAAFGAFSSTGAGTGAALTDTTVVVTLAPGSTSGELYPGGTAAARTVAGNSNPGPVRIVSLALDTTQGAGGFTVSGTGCPASAFSFATQDNAGNGWTVPGDGTLAITLPAAVSMALNAANACQGVTVTVFLRAVT